MPTTVMPIKQQGSSTYQDLNAGQTDLFLTKLTDKLSQNIRDEVRKELALSTCNQDMREAVSSKMESYLEAELGTQ